MHALANARSIFADAIDLSAPERAAYLDAACGGDAALRAEVADLLAADARAGGFLGGRAALGPDTAPGAPHTDAPEPAGGPTTRAWDAEPPAAPTDHAGAVLAGRYKLIEPIGEGGMGTVWLAEQTAPVKRLVAVKLVKDGMDTKQVLARFDAERQALALMDHPNIAKVLDAGATGAGRPFFVMELVEGVPITRFCDERNLTPRERLELFVPVCQAIQHAHQKGVIHRDVKPSNVLVALYDGRPVPKVIDFGVAKAAGAALTDRTLHTGFGLVGTPEYMAPEQAELNQFDVDTRADVYALGVLFYELLTGAPPFTRSDLPGSGLLDILRAVRERTPARPSTRLGSSHALPALAARRSTEPRKLAGLVRGELDWIALKALEKDRDRRYETANGLAKDVERYLSGEPVQAVPPSAAYRLRTLVRRNRGPVAAAALLVLALAAGVAGTTAGLVRADRQRDAAEKARRDAEGARGEAEAERTAALAERDAKEQARQAEAEQRKLTEAEKKRAEDEREFAQSATEFLRDDLLGQADMARQAGRQFVPDPHLTMRTALDRAAARVGDRFRNKPRVEAAIRRTIGESYLAVGEHGRAIEQLVRAVTLLEPPAGADPKSKAVQDHLDVVRSLGHAYLGAKLRPEGIEQFRRVLAGREEAFGADDAAAVRALHDFAESYREVNGKERDRLLELVIAAYAKNRGADASDTVRARFHLAFAQANRSKVQALIPALERLNRQARPPAPGELPDREALDDVGRLGAAYLFVGRAREAVPLLEEVRDGYELLHGRNHYPTLKVWAELSYAYARADLPDESLRAGEQIWAEWKKGHGEKSAGALAAAFNLSMTYREAGRTWDAIRVIEETLPARREVFGARSWTTIDPMQRLIPMLEQMGQFERAAELRAELKVAKMPLPVAPAPRRK